MDTLTLALLGLACVTCVLVDLCIAVRRNTAQLRRIAETLRIDPDSGEEMDPVFRPDAEMVARENGAV